MGEHFYCTLKMLEGTALYLEPFQSSVARVLMRMTVSLVHAHALALRSCGISNTA